MPVGDGAARLTRPRAARAAGVGRLDLVAVEPGGVDGGVAELVARGQRPQEADVGGEAEDGGLVERGDQRPAGLLAGRAVGDDLAEHRVVRRAHDLPGLERVVDPDTGAARPPDDGVAVPAWGRKPAERVLGVHPRLDGVAADGDVVLGDRQRLAGGDAELELDQVEARRDRASVTGCSTWRRVFISRK